MSYDGSGAAALVAAFYPGELGGEAIVSVLLGEVAPSGRLPVTVYAATWADQREPTDMTLPAHPRDDGLGVVPGATYWYVNASDVLFPFGFGLSYTEWSLSWAAGFTGNVTVDASDWASGKAAPSFNATLSNTGGVTSDSSTLGFVSSGLVGEPALKLFDFSCSSSIAPGASVSVPLTVPAEVAALVTVDGAHVLTPGLYGIQVGGDSLTQPASSGPSALLGWLQVTGSPVIIEDLPW